MATTLITGGTVVSATGRGEADVLIDGLLVSRRHAQVKRTERGSMLTDLGSTNGTYVNGAPVTRALPVGPGTAIRIGKTVMELEA